MEVGKSAVHIVTNQNIKKYLLITAGFLVVHAIILYFMGQIPICKCGYVKLWLGALGTSEGSQHIADWYTFSHIIHGFAFYFFLWLVNKKWKMPLWVWLIFALLFESAWEIFENTDFVINRYREVTISLDYYGDSIINSLSDIAAMLLGFVLARKLPVSIIIFLIIAMEAFVGFSIRDNLILNIIMLIYPLDAIKYWQMGV